MAGGSLLSLLDDIAGLLDDVATLTKVATKKTAGVLGDDLALNAQQVTGVAADRELPVVWAVAKGSALNKLIIVPTALAISAVASWAVTVLLMLGGAFLCFEGFEKIAHKVLHRSDPDEEARRRQEHLAALAKGDVDILALEKEKIRGAIRTDIILSAEIIVITLGTVADEPFLKQLAVLSVVAAGMTVGVYGFVAGIVKLDDLGLALSRRPSPASQTVGRGILAAAPYLMKALSIAGTAAMFLVGGGILSHGIPPIHHWAEHVHAAAGAWGGLATMAIQGGVGIVVGAVVALLVAWVQRFRKGATAAGRPA